MTDQNMIPADKVRELKTKYEYDTSGDPERLLDHLLHDLDDLLPAPAQPTSGLLGRWAKHPDYGDVMCVANESVNDKVLVFHLHLGSGESLGALVPLDSLTFPHQATRPADVPAGEAWLVRHVDGGEFNALKTSGPFPWQFFNGEFGENDGYRDASVTLVCPLVPERPVSDLQARYDELESKYREAQERVEALSQSTTPHTVTTEAEYAALPEGSMIVDADDDVWRKGLSGNWIQEMSYQMLGDAKLSGTTRTVLRYGWGDAQAAWRIERDHKNLKVGEYIIDCEDDDGTVTHKRKMHWDTDGDAYGAPYFAPFIVFPNKDAATPEAIEEAKQARDKETEK